jgi:Tol biopolymer transport system component
MFRRDRTDPAVTAQHSQVTFDGRVLGAAISPDGRSIAFSAARGTDDVRVFVRDIAAGQALEIWKGISVQQLAWLADNARIAMSGGRPQSANLWIVPRFGGEPRALPFQSAFVSPSPDGSRLALSSYSSGGFRVISLDGEELSPVPQSLRNIRQIEWVAPDKVVALEVPPSGDSSVWAMTPRGENVRRVYFSADRMLGICASPATGAIYAIRQQQESADLLRIPDEGSSASPRVLATGLSLFETGFSIVNGCSVSTDGKRLVYRRGVQHANLWRLDLEGGNRAATQLTRGTAMLELPSISSDDRWIAATRGTGANAEIVKIPADGGEPTPIAAGRNPAWSPDGKRIAFISYRSGRATVWVITDQGLAAAEIPGSDVSNLHLIWMTDGRIAWPVAGARNYRIHDPASGRGENLLSDDQVRMGWLIRARLSPDGKRFAAYWNRKDGRGLWTIAWPGREARFLGDGLWPVGWSADGASIYAHKHGDGQMLRVSPETGRAEPVGRFEGTTLEGGCDMTADRRAMVCALLERSSDVWLIEHFDPEVTAKPKT